MNPAQTPLRYRRINRRNGSIQKISSESYASRKGIPSNTPLNVSPQRTFKNDFSPIQLQNFKDELGIKAADSVKKRRKPKRPLNIDDILGGKNYKGDYGNFEDEEEISPVRNKKDKYRSDKSAGYRKRGIPQDSKVKRRRRKERPKELEKDPSRSRDNSRDKEASRSRIANRGSRDPDMNRFHDIYGDNST